MLVYFSPCVLQREKLCSSVLCFFCGVNVACKFSPFGYRGPLFLPFKLDHLFILSTNQFLPCPLGKEMCGCAPSGGERAKCWLIEGWFTHVCLSVTKCVGTSCDCLRCSSHKCVTCIAMERITLLGCGQITRWCCLYHIFSQSPVLAFDVGAVRFSSFLTLGHFLASPPLSLTKRTAWLKWRLSHPSSSK